MHICSTKQNMALATKRIRISSNGLNRFKYRVMTAGAILEPYKENPVVLWGHNLGGVPIATMTDLKIEGDEITGLPDFDDEDPEAMRIYRKYEKGLVKACSIGFEPLAYSEDPADMLPGQLGPTVTSWELMEISLLPVPSNREALQLGYDVSEATSKKVAHLTIKPKHIKKMDLILQQLGLEATATEQQAVDAIAGMQNQMLQRDVETLVLGAKNKGQLAGAESEAAFRTLAAHNLTAAKQFVESMPEMQTLGAQPNTPGAAAPTATTPAAQAAAPTTLMSRMSGAQLGAVNNPADPKATWGFLEWSQKDPKGLAEIRKTEPDRYMALAAAYTGK
jgi:HK97 family phage prohead protease